MTEPIFGDGDPEQIVDTDGLPDIRNDEAVDEPPPVDHGQGE